MLNFLYVFQDKIDFSYSIRTTSMPPLNDERNMSCMFKKEIINEIRKLLSPRAISGHPNIFNGEPIRLNYHDITSHLNNSLNVLKHLNKLDLTDIYVYVIDTYNMTLYEDNGSWFLMY